MKRKCSIWTIRLLMAVLVLGANGQGRAETEQAQRTDTAEGITGDDEFMRLLKATGLAGLEPEFQWFVLDCEVIPVWSDVAGLYQVRIWDHGKPQPTAWQLIASKHLLPPEVHPYWDKSWDPIALRSLAVSPNNRTAATVDVRDVLVFGRDGSIISQYHGPSPFEHEGDPLKGPFDRPLPPPQSIAMLLVSDDGSTYAATTARGSCAVLRAGMWERITGWKPVGRSVLSSTGRYVASGRGLLMIGDLQQKEVIFSQSVVPEDEELVASRFLLDESGLIVLSVKGGESMVRLIDLGGTTLMEKELPGRAERLRISDNGKWLCVKSYSHNTARFLDLQSFEQLFQISSSDLCRLRRARGEMCHVQN